MPLDLHHSSQGIHLMPQLPPPQPTKAQPQSRPLRPLGRLLFATDHPGTRDSVVSAKNSFNGDEEARYQARLGVILFPEPYMGHQTLMLHLGNVLYSKGFSTTIIQTLPNFTFLFIEDALSKSESPPSDPLEIFHALNASCLDPFRVTLSRALEYAYEGNKPVACLISDPMWEFASAVADGFNLPRMALRTRGCWLFLFMTRCHFCAKRAASLSKVLLQFLRQTGTSSTHVRVNQETQLEEPFPELPSLKVKDLPLEAQHELMAKMVKETKSYSQGIICNTFKELEGSILDRVHENFHSVPIFPVGPLHKHSTGDTLAQEPSLISKEQFLEIAWELAESKQPFLWVVRPKFVNGSQSLLPEDFLEAVAGRAHIVTWTPQQQVLANPAIGGGAHDMSDQKMNDRRTTAVLGIGLLLEKGLERDEIKIAIRRLIVEKEGKEKRERSAGFRENTKLCLSVGGSSYENLDQLTKPCSIISQC
ncbi:hypothetical protein Cgig2_032681 [Carnegiea gigantea]|uniref:Uncharacterized protein n=1 Tax=Carnegiea gigantea TaxID=171969 RepID=A0A9Q1KIG7_9CARY|nr:hypothetical protein Cgig2_032681 [Carnegiea gigantea]